MLRIFERGWSTEYDGPGRRRIYYLKGCNLRCRWCANPESLQAEPEILFYPERFTGQPEICPAGAIEHSVHGYSLNHEACDACTHKPCVTMWKHPAFRLAGESVTLDALLDDAKQSQAFFGANGGVTLGGGEATMQPRGVDFLRMLRAEDIHTAVESNASTKSFREFCIAADLMICDLKCITPDACETWLGNAAGVLSENLRFAADTANDLWVRIPLVCGVNDGGAQRDAIARELLCLQERRPALRVEVLPMHHLGAPKWAALGRAYPAAELRVPQQRDIEMFIEYMDAVGIRLIDAATYA